jgi:hypothetical protein
MLFFSVDGKGDCGKQWGRIINCPLFIVQDELFAGPGDMCIEKNVFMMKVSSRQA